MTQAVIRFYRNVELDELAPAWMGVAKEVSDDIAAEFPKDAACAAGCSHCCSVWVGVLPTEAHRLVDHVRRNLPPVQRQAILDGIKLRAMVASSVPPEDYREEGLPCVFLDEAGQCSVYAIRPLVCRSFGSTDAGYCASDKEARVAYREEKGSPNFIVSPVSAQTLMATSGLWFGEMNNSMLGVWSEGGVRLEISTVDLAKVQTAQHIADAALQAEAKPKPLGPVIATP